MLAVFLASYHIHICVCVSLMSAFFHFEIIAIKYKYRFSNDLYQLQQLLLINFKRCYRYNYFLDYMFGVFNLALTLDISVLEL